MNDKLRAKLPHFTPIAVIAAVIAVIAIIAIIITNSTQTEYPISDLERIALEEYSTKYSNYLEELDSTYENEIDNPTNPVINGFHLDRYISYAIEYSYNENDDADLTADELVSFINSSMNIDLKKDDVVNIGITPYLLDKNITYDPAEESYSIHKVQDKRDVANTPITKYIENRAHTNKDKSIYTVVYDKYTIKNPYDILPHLTGETSGVKDYLNGKGKITSIKKAITSESIKNIASEPEKQLTVEYSVKDNYLVIKTIK